MLAINSNLSIPFRDSGQNAARAEVVTENDRYHRSIANIQVKKLLPDND